VTCKLVRTKEFSAFQCTINELGGPSIPDESTKPYDDHECMHLRRFENRGVLTCKDCSATYDEKTLEWRNDV
jgi:hypothetical protein